jgi:hypothetical protein
MLSVSNSDTFVTYPAELLILVLVPSGLHSLIGKVPD